MAKKFLFATYCSRLRKEGIVECGDSVPAREICPLCGCFFGKCNFTMKQISVVENAVGRVLNSPLDGLHQNVEPNDIHPR